MNLQPIFLKLDGRPGLLVGAGNVALEKLNTMLSSGVRLRVIAPAVKPEFHRFAEQGKIDLVQRRYTSGDLDGNFIVIAATDDPQVNATVYRESVERGILVNSVDDPPHCDFYFGSVIRRGDLQVAISTAGESPAVAQQLRREIDEQLPADVGPWLTQVGQLRREILATYPAGEERKALLHRIAKRRMLQPAKPATDKHNQSRVYLVGAGPGDPDLLTVKAQRLIGAADVILHDDLVTPEILALASPAAEIVNVGKRCGTKNITQEEINSLLVSYASDHQLVVRLKSGDPMIFGRAAEEMNALKEAGVPFDVVPGITAAFAAAAAIPFSLTDRHAASNVVFSTGHHAQSHNEAAIPELEDATRIVYMPGRDLALLALEWSQEGLPGNFPCAIVSCAGRPEQEVLHTTLSALSDAKGVKAPSILMAGWALKDSVDTRLQAQNAALNI
jgi:uroporphyrin-III C-methyltransferase/precorrin-2 dehydrogenase/sirohydrochlorin ferrochelatase